MPKGPSGMRITPIQARSTSSMLATPDVTSVMAAVQMLESMALNT